MELYIGGYAQGKLDYVMKKLHNRQFFVADGGNKDVLLELSKAKADTQVVFYHFHSWIRQLIEQKKDAEKYRKRAVKYARWSTRYYKQNTWKSKVKGILYPVVNAFLRKTKLEEKNFRKFEEVCKRYNNMETKYVTTLEFSFDIERWGKRLKSYFDKVEYMPFEFIKLPISVDYEEMLRNDYGDYMVFKKGASAHGDMIIDTDRSYTEYINKITKDKSGNK